MKEFGREEKKDGNKIRKIIKINLNTVVSGAIHRHSYKRVDGKQASNYKYVREVEKQEEIYTSPRNVRKLFIKHTGIDVVYYQPVIGKVDSLYESINFSASDIMGLKIYAKELIDNWFRGTEITQVKLVGTGFASFLNDLSLSNLEEIYFDWSLLLGNRELFLNVYNLSRMLSEPITIGLDSVRQERFCSLASNERKTVRILQANKLSEYSLDKNVRKVATALYSYIASEMGGSSDLSQKYPRLKHIGLLNNTNISLKSKGAISKEELILYDNQAIYNHYKINQLNDYKKVPILFNLFFDTDVNLYTAGFRVDPGLYQFDKKILASYLKEDKTFDGVTQEVELTQWFKNSRETKLGLEAKLKWSNKLNEGKLVGQKREVEVYNKEGFDKYGFGRDGFNNDGWNKRGYNRDGYNKHGYDNKGYDREGYNTRGYTQDGFDREGYDIEDYGRDGYNRDGYNREGYNKYGYDSDGLGKDGYDRDGYDKWGYGKDGYNRDGYDSDGLGKDGYDRDGYDRFGLGKNGYDKDGYNRFGYNRDGYDKEGYNEFGYASDGYNKYGYDWNSFGRDGFGRDGYDKRGYNSEGCDREGYNKEGYDKAGYNRNGLNELGHRITNCNEADYSQADYSQDGYNKDGYDKEGYNKEGYNKDGYNRYGYNKEGYNQSGYNRMGFNKCWRRDSDYNRDGYDEYGYDREGFNEEGYNEDGLNKDGYDREGYNEDGYYRDGFNEYEDKKHGEM